MTKRVLANDANNDIESSVKRKSENVEEYHETYNYISCCRPIGKIICLIVVGVVISKKASFRIGK